MKYDKLPDKLMQLQAIFGEGLIGCETHSDFMTSPAPFFMNVDDDEELILNFEDRQIVISYDWQKKKIQVIRSG